MNACPKCSKPLSPTARFCGGCGYVVKMMPPQKCPKCGNNNDSSAKKCQYCSAPLGESQGQPAAPATPSRATPAGREEGYIPTETIGAKTTSIPNRKTDTIDSPVSVGAPAASQKGKTGSATTVIPAPGQSEAQVQERKVVGVLVTYTWKSAGQLFPIREGRNRIGRDSNECDIFIAEDNAMSSKHAFLLFDPQEQCAFLSDEGSQNGTFVNESNIRRNEKRLENYSTIRTGTTKWTFVLVHPAAYGTATERKEE